MKILQVSHLYPIHYDPLNSIAVHKQIKTLTSKGLEVKVISGVAWSPFPIKYMTKKWQLYSQVPEHSIIDGIKVFYPRYLVFPKLFLLASSGMRMYYGIRGFVKKLHRHFPFDLIHAHMALPDGYAAMLLARDYDIPYIVTLQATDLDVTVNRNNQCFQILQKIFANADSIISPTPRLSRSFSRLFPQIKLVTIGYGMDPGEIYTGSNDILSRDGNHRILLSVSRLIPTKGIDLNLYALKKLIPKHGNLLYMIIGDGPARPALERLVDHLNLNAHVKFLGKLPYHKVMEYMSICDIFVMPSWQETFGLVYIESMAHGKPIIGCQGQGVDGIVTDGETGFLVRPKDVESLVEALDFALSHPEKAKAMGERARKLVLENYTLGKNADSTMSIYKKVLDNKVKGPSMSPLYTTHSS